MPKRFDDHTVRQVALYQSKNPDISAPAVRHLLQLDGISDLPSTRTLSIWMHNNKSPVGDNYVVRTDFGSYAVKAFHPKQALMRVLERCPSDVTHLSVEVLLD